MNNLTIVGRLTQDMEFKPYENKTNGKKGFRLSGRIAIERNGMVDKDGKKLVDFLPIQSWITEPQRKYFGDSLKKGAKILLNGSIRVDNYLDKNTNQNRTYTYGTGKIDIMEYAKEKGENMSQNNQAGYQPPKNAYQPAQTGYQPPQTGYQPPQDGFNPTYDVLSDEEIPF